MMFRLVFVTHCEAFAERGLAPTAVAHGDGHRMLLLCAVFADAKPDCNCPQSVSHLDHFSILSTTTTVTPIWRSRHSGRRGGHSFLSNHMTLLYSNTHLRRLTAESEMYHWAAYRGPTIEVSIPSTIGHRA
jgi:hypothetical protein